jgi:hypothetical protein
MSALLLLPVVAAVVYVVAYALGYVEGRDAARRTAEDVIMRAIGPAAQRRGRWWDA